MPFDREMFVSEAERLGFSRVGFARAGPARDSARLARWLAEGQHGTMEWMAHRTAERADPRRLLPGAKTVVSLATDYSTAPPAGSAQWIGRVSRYAWGRDYHHVVGRRLRKLARFVEREAPGERAIAAVDFKPVLEREWAERSGLGWIGKHTNVIMQDRGSWFFLGEIVTTIDLAPEAERQAANRCGKCADCITACPTGAIVAPYVVDARRCISYLTIELEGPIPRELRPHVGEWIFGCDVCQDVCPWNRFAVPVDEPRFRLDAGRFDGDLAQFLALDETSFAARFEGSPVKRAGRDGFLRNVCVALGNRGRYEDVASLAKALDDPAPLVRCHAAWALGRIGGRGALGALETRGAIESEADVREEIAAALHAAHGPAERDRRDPEE